MMTKKLKSRIIRNKIVLAAHRELFQLLRAKNEHCELLEAQIVRVNTVITIASMAAL